MTIGLPRSLFYYRYNTLFKAFFKELGINYVVSNITNKKHCYLYYEVNN